MHSLKQQANVPFTRRPLCSRLPPRVALPKAKPRVLPAANVFTGIVQGIGEVVDTHPFKLSSTIAIKLAPEHMQAVPIGGSVAVNGVCLTVAAASRDQLTLNIVSETLRATTLSELGAGSLINYERAVRVGEEIGGHLISGHVHTTAKISSITATEHNRRVCIELGDPKWMKYIIHKGSIAVDGTSLTIGEVSDSGFSVYLIPHTLKTSIWGIKAVGDNVNLEFDATTITTVEYVQRHAKQVLATLGMDIHHHYSSSSSSNNDNTGCT